MKTKKAAKKKKIKPQNEIVVKDKKVEIVRIIK